MFIPIRIRLVGAIVQLAVCALVMQGCNTPPITHAPDRVNGSLGPPTSQPATAAEWTDLTIKLDEARAEVNRKAAELEAKARNEAKIVDGCRLLGLAMIPGGIAIAVFVSRKLGIWVSAGGAMCLALGMFLGRLAPWIDWAAGAGIIGGSLYGIGSAFTTIWTKWKTNEQAAAKRRLAEATTDGVQAAVLIAEANTLEHVGTPQYDARKVLPGGEAVSMIQEAIK